MDIQRGFRIGPWTVSPLTGDVQAAGEAVHLEPKVMEVLVVLAENAEAVVLRDELLEKIWGARAATSDEPLTRCIAQLRQSLGDSSRNPRYIQTVPKRGYRLMVPALPLEETPAETTPPDAAQHSRLLRAHGDTLRAWQSVGMIGALAVIGLIAYVTISLMLKPADTDSLDPCRIERAEQLFPTIRDDAYELCVDGTKEMGERTADSIRFAMNYFRRAIAIEPEYGSAIVNLARAMVLLPTYEAFPDPDDCRYDDNASDQTDCYDAAIKLLNRNRATVPYIQSYVYGIEGYVFTKNLRWQEALGAFRFAEVETPNDADMWQWNSQFRAAVGDLDAALDAIQMSYALNPASGVILDRYHVILMWLDRDEEAERVFRQATGLAHVPYEASLLVRSIRQQSWDEVRDLLRRHVGRERADVGWIDDFLAGLSDANQRPRATAAVETAVASGELTGQYIYGAWALLGEPERAIDAALRLLDEKPGDINVEFLFTRETLAMRQHPRFIEIVRSLELDDYWQENEGNCPALFERRDEVNWCD